MQRSPLAGLLALAALGAQAQALTVAPKVEALVVTAHRGMAAESTLRDATVITRDDIEAAGALSLGELLERRAGLELRSTGGPGQPQSILIRGAGPAQTLVLIDGLRAGSATQGTTAIEGIPLEMIERIEIVRGPMSSLYGSEAAGGVIQVFTRGKAVPHLFVSGGYGSERDRRLAAGLTTAEKDTVLSLSMGARRVDASSATSPRAGFLHDPDRDPHENAFFNARVAHTMWQGETLALEAFGTRSRTDFDSGVPPEGVRDRSEQTISGARLTSSAKFTEWWASRLAFGQGRDELRIEGQFPARFETLQDQASWINEFYAQGGLAILGLEALRQRVLPEEDFAVSRRDFRSGFATFRQSFQGQRLEAAIRRDAEDQLGKHNTGSASYGYDWPGVLRAGLTYAKGFRAPTFNDLYGPSFGDFYHPNPDLRPERSKGREISLRSVESATWSWRLTHFDNRFEDLIVFSPAAATMLNVSNARIRGLELESEGTWRGNRLRVVATGQRPRDEATGLALQGRAERYGSVEGSRSWGDLTVGLVVRASGPRFDSTNEAPSSRLPGYAVIDARARYVFNKFVTAELSATNLGDVRYETALGYPGRARGVFLSVRFEAF